MTIDKAELRRIAEGLRIGHIPLHEPCDKEIAYLLNALVDATERAIIAECGGCLLASMSDPPKIDDTKRCNRNHKALALTSLGLDKVWPPKEEG